MELYTINNYKIALRERLNQQKALYGSSVNYSKLAEACRVQKTYLSKVLKHDGDLSEDQLYLACEFLNFDTEQRDYIFLLYQRDRTQILERKQNLEAIIKGIRANQNKTEMYFRDEPVETRFDSARYYLNPLLQILHICLTVPEYSQSPKVLSRRLGFSDTQIKWALSELVKMGLVREEFGSIAIMKDNLHLKKDDPIFNQYISAHRVNTITRLNSHREIDTYNFSAIFSLAESDVEMIQKEFFRFIGLVKRRVNQARSEKVYQMNFDLFDWA